MLACVMAWVGVTGTNRPTWMTCKLLINLSPWTVARIKSETSTAIMLPSSPPCHPTWNQHVLGKNWKYRNLDHFISYCTIHCWNTQSILLPFHVWKHWCLLLFSHHFILIRFVVDPWAQGGNTPLDRMPVRPVCLSIHTLDHTGFSTSTS